jgi:hypothetical protein
MKIVFFGDSLTQGTYGVGYLNKVAAALRGPSRTACSS